MRISLSNNKKLLKKRNMLFNKNSSIAELKGRYSRLQRLQTQPLTKEQKESILCEVKARNRAENVKIFFSLSAALAFMIMVVIVLFFMLFPNHNREGTAVAAVHDRNRKGDFKQHVIAGKKALRGNKPFFAIGSFEAALQIKPGNETAVKLLMESYLLLCEKNQKSCGYSNRAVDSLEKRYSFITGDVEGGSDQ